MSFQPATIQISLGICQVKVEASLFAPPFQMKVRIYMRTIRTDKTQGVGGTA